MVDNVFIQCDYCKAKIRMRFQMGYFDIPFDFPCPECGVHIHGLRRITEEHSLKLNNAAVVEFDLNELLCRASPCQDNQIRIHRENSRQRIQPIFNVFEPL